VAGVTVAGVESGSVAGQLAVGLGLPGWFFEGVAIASSKLDALPSWRGGVPCVGRAPCAGGGLALGVRIFRGLSSNAPADVRLWVALDVHKFSIVAAMLPPVGGTP
jgi:hypothetical protein